MLASDVGIVTSAISTLGSSSARAASWSHLSDNARLKSLIRAQQHEGGDSKAMGTPIKSNVSRKLGTNDPTPTQATSAVHGSADEGKLLYDRLEVICPENKKLDLANLTHATGGLLISEDSVNSLVILWITADRSSLPSAPTNHNV